MADQQTTPSSTTPTTPGRPLKYTVEHYRKEGVTEQAFLDWFRNVHIPAALPLMKKHGIVGYAVLAREPEVATAFQSEVDKVRPGWIVSTCDLVLEYWVPDLGCVTALVMDPDWDGKACKNQEDWLDMSRATMHVGYDTMYLRGGEIVDL
ncbi:MAG: hypothetical protein Q9160_002886 [Pyrenula sp. 1 TL-2023]